MTDVVAGLIHLEGKLLICQRHHSDKHHPLKWEFPGGKVQADENSEDALIRELQEELGIQVLEYDLLTSYEFSYPERQAVKLHFFLVNDYLSLVKNLQFETIRWIDPQHIADFDFLAGDEKIVTQIIQKEINIPESCAGCPLH